MLNRASELCDVGCRRALLRLCCCRHRDRDGFRRRAARDCAKSCQSDDKNDGVDFHWRHLSNGYASISRSTGSPS